MTCRVCAFWLVLVPLYAQHFQASYPITVELRLPPEQTNAQLRGELTGATPASFISPSWMSSGKIEFLNVPAGSYQLNIVNARGVVVKTLFVESSPNHSPIPVDLIAASKLPAGSVSIHQLLHRPSANAVRLLGQARRLKGVEAVNLLHQAIVEDPEFFEAHVILGSALLQLKQTAASALEFEKAVTERPDSAIAANDLALSYIALRRAADAEPFARRALVIDSTMLEAHFALAEALITQVIQSPESKQRQSWISEAVVHLKLCEGKFPQANALLEWARQSR